MADQSVTARLDDKAGRGAPPSMSWPAIHEAVEGIMESFPRGRVLDMPCGAGALTWRLLRLGFDATGCDIDTGNFAVAGHNAVEGDLSSRFPFENESFDHAVFVEGPEHVADPLNAFREFARVLKPGGKLVVTLPNYTSITRRLKFLLNGTHEPVFSMEEATATFGDALPMMHISPMTAANIYQLLELAGMRLVSVHRDKRKRKQLALLPFAAIVMAIGRIDAKASRKYKLGIGNQWNVLMGGNTLIIVAEKRGR